jgi:hypothetical protein
VVAAPRSLRKLVESNVAQQLSTDSERPFVETKTHMKTAILFLFAGVLPLVAFAGSGDTNGPQPGLQAEIFAYNDSLDDYPTNAPDKKPTITRVDKNIDVDAGDDEWPGTKLVDHFYIRWTGKVRVPKDGKYTFFLNSDDGSRLFIDGKLVFDNGGIHGAEEQSGAVELKSGDHELKIEFFENEGQAVCQFSWQVPDKTKEIVPASVLFH